MPPPWEQGGRFFLSKNTSEQAHSSSYGLDTNVCSTILFMQTKAIYLDDSYQKEMDAQVLTVEQEDEGRWRVILDQTVFYPMGGGQSTDQGELTYDGQSAKVYQVQTKDGEIWHFIETTTPPTQGMSVHGVIDWERRYMNMKLHSAGHIVDFAMYQLGYSPATLIPYKGDHGKKAFIMYQGILGKDIKGELEAKSRELVQKDLELSWEFQSYEALEKEAIYLQPFLPKDKPLRTLRLEGVGAVADGGTQVKKTSEVGLITITAVDEEDGNTKVSYVIE